MFVGGPACSWVGIEVVSRGGESLLEKRRGDRHACSWVEGYGVRRWVSSAHLGALRVRSTQVGALRVRSTQVGALRVRSTQVGGK